MKAKPKFPAAKPKPKTSLVPKLPPPPTHLAETEKALWTSLIAENEVADSASLAILSAACEAHGRARECREAIKRDGATFRDRFNQIRVHPLLAPERDARAAFITSIKALNFDLTGETTR